MPVWVSEDEKQRIQGLVDAGLSIEDTAVAPPKAIETPQFQPDWSQMLTPSAPPAPYQEPQAAPVPSSYQPSAPLPQQNIFQTPQIAQPSVSGPWGGIPPTNIFGPPVSTTPPMASGPWQMPAEQGNPALELPQTPRPQFADEQRARQYDILQSAPEAGLGDVLGRWAGQNVAGATESLLPEDWLGKLPDPWYFPAQQVAGAYTSPLGIATIGAGAGPAGFGAAALRNFGIVTGGAAAQTGYAGSGLPGADNPWAQAAVGVVGGVGGFVVPGAVRNLAGRAGAAAESAGGARPLLAGERGSGPGFGGNEPLTSGPVPEAKPTGELAPLGDAAARDAIQLKETTTAHAGPLGRAVGALPGVKKIAGVANPSINLERDVHVANQARAAVDASLTTDFNANMRPLTQQMKAAIQKSPPEYVGPAGNRLAGTYPDIMENPQFYQELSPEVWSLAQQIKAEGERQLNVARAQYGVDMGLHVPENPDGFYVPRVNNNESLLERINRTEQSMAQGGVLKERVWETAEARARADPNFIPETDPVKLWEMHSNAIASAAAKNTFGLGTGGLTRPEVMAELHPALAARYDALRTRLQSLKGTLSGLDDRVSRNIDNFLGLPNVEEADLTALAADLDPTIGANAVGVEGRNFGKGRAAIRAEVQQAKEEVKQLRPMWKNANTQPYVFNQSVYRYLSPEASRSVDEVLRLSNGALDKPLAALNMLRVTALSSDTSPFTGVQGPLNMFRAPFTTAKVFARAIAQGGTAGLEDVARTEPDLVSRFTQARMRGLGSIGQEFSPAESLAVKIPKVGPVLGRVEQGMFNVIDRMNYDLWKNVRSGLMKMGYAEDIADHEAAIVVHKSVPMLSPAERGVSPARGAVERAFLTSVSFTTAPLSLAKDAASAVVKMAAFQRPRGRELVALQQLLQITGTITGIAAVSAAVTAEDRGLSVEEAIKRAITPGTSDFWKLRFPGVGPTINLGGPFRSTIQGFTPYQNGEWGPPNLWQWAKGKLSPPISTGIQAGVNKDFYGYSIRKPDDAWYQDLLRTAGFVAEGNLPLSLGAVASGARTGLSGEEIATNAIGQFGGQNVSTPSATEQLNVLARKQSGKDFFDLDTAEKNQLMANPEAKALAAEQVQGSAERGSPSAQNRIAADAIRTRATTEQQAADATLQAAFTPANAQKWRDERKTMQTYVAGAMDAIYANTPQGPAKDAVGRYGQAIKDATTGTAPGTVDWEKVDRWMAAQPAADQAYIAANTGLGGTPLEKQYHADVKAIEVSGYFNIRDEQFGKFLQAIGEKGQWKNDQAFFDALTQDYIDQARAKGITDPVKAGQYAQAHVDRYSSLWGQYLGHAERLVRQRDPAVGDLIRQWGLGGTGARELMQAATQ